MQDLINHYQLQPHPEGGYYIRTYQSTDHVLTQNTTRFNGETRLSSTAIYFLLNQTDFSAWHRIKSDEMWHHYKGSVVQIHVIDQQGQLHTHYLGDPTIHRAASFQVCVPAGCWFAADNVDKDTYSFVGCTVSPGFDFKDFEMGEREALLQQYPSHRERILRLTR